MYAENVQVNRVSPFGPLKSWNKPVRRAQRLSYVLTALVPESMQRRGASMLLRLPSIAARLRIALGNLRGTRRRLTALVALKQSDLKGGGGQ